MTTDATAPDGTGAPDIAPVAVAPVIAPAEPIIAAAPTATAEPTVDPNWLNGRLERAKKAGQELALKEIGATNLDEARAAIKAVQDAAEARKTLEQKAAETAQLAKAAQTTAEKQAALIREHAGRMLMALTPAQQKTITDFAGEDPAEQLRAIHHFAPTWAAAETAKEEAAKVAAAAVTPAPAPVAAPPAQTSPAPNAPAGTSPGSPPDHRTVYESTRQTNPFAAAAYGLRNPLAYQSKT